MSDSDADDSGFDREAERERLREKYENEDEERAETERMSELLLQGATMTNKHCDTCGNPIFRYDGQEFCAVCQQPTDEQGGGADQTAGEASMADRSQQPDPQRVEAQASAPDDPDPRESVQSPGQNRRREPPTQAADSPASGEGDVESARASLVRTLTTLAQYAEASDDVRQTREYLEAATEAAEALAAIDDLR